MIAPCGKPWGKSSGEIFYSHDPVHTGSYTYRSYMTQMIIHKQTKMATCRLSQSDLKTGIRGIIVWHVKMNGLCAPTVVSVVAICWVSGWSIGWWLMQVDDNCILLFEWSELAGTSTGEWKRLSRKRIPYQTIQEWHLQIDIHGTLN